MSDLRHDPLDDTWVAMASNRRSRPMEFVPLEQVRQQIICPFCKGNESETPRPLAVYGDDGAALPRNELDVPWTCRVVANKYPSFSTADIDEPDPCWASQVDATDQPGGTPMPFQVDRAHGTQELVIPSPRHLTSVSELNERELKLSFAVHRDRMENLRQMPGIVHGMLFLNCRSGAGASLGHLHWQLIGSPLVSGFLRRRSEQNRTYREQHGTSLLAALTAWEMKQQIRVLRITDQFCIVCPFASRFPFQVLIVPRNLNDSFTSCSAAARDELAWHCRDVVTRLESLLDHAAYNIQLHTPIFERFDDEPWYVELYPRLTVPAGFERGTDIWVNPVAPETAARALRAAEENRGGQP